MLVEEQRLKESEERVANWQRWGPYLAERQWATVREDYSADGNVWDYFPHDHARSRAYRWGEDGLLGITDRECRLCFALALWNGQDPILKERLFGLTGPQGNHGEDVKECYYYLDSAPSHAYMKALYKYPQSEFPYAQLMEENRNRGLREREFELSDTGIFNENRYFDVFAEYAKAAPNDILIKVTIFNRGPEPAALHVLPTLWFRNSWSWGCEHEGCTGKPELSRQNQTRVETKHELLENFAMEFEPLYGDAPNLLFTENETNHKRLFDTQSESPYVKDAFHRYAIEGEKKAVNPRGVGTKTAAHYMLQLEPGESKCLRMRLFMKDESPKEVFGESFEQIFEQCIQETDEFYKPRMGACAAGEARNVMRQAYAGLLWTKQFYHISVKHWLKGDPTQPEPPPEHRNGRNRDWTHLFNRDVISMPDKWEYPWYAAWDLAFHMLPFADIDPPFTKKQLILFLREWYMHPNGQIPAYEFAFDDVNPPVHAWAAWRVYKITAPRGKRDLRFLSRIFQKLLINFTWWVNRKDVEGRHVFAGGFLGLDNIGVFDRSRPLPSDDLLMQADGTAWMAFYCTIMLEMALELAADDPAYEDVASKFFEHFVAISDAINSLDGTGLWEEEDGFYYDHIRSGGKSQAMKVRSLVGLIPLVAAANLDCETIGKLPGFTKRMNWFLEHRKDLARYVSYMNKGKCPDTKRMEYLLAIPSRERLERVLRYMLDENEFFSPYGIRSLSKFHQQNPYVFHLDGEDHRVDYEPAESTTYMFGGNSNWRGPVWFPINYLLMEALERYHHFYGDDLKVECPTGSGNMMNLKQVSQELNRRLSRIFLPGETGERPVNGGERRYTEDPHWRDLVLFYEYFHGDNGRGVGASHQTGWTALITRCLKKCPDH